MKLLTKNEVNSFKKIVSQCNSKSQIMAITGYNLNTVNKLLKELQLDIVVNCIHCGKVIPRKPYGVNKKYCSHSCSYEHKLLEKECKYCGKSFKGTRGTHYCSKSCKSKAAKGVLVKCNCCGKEFKSYHYSKYCSKECQNLVRKGHLLTCEVCGNEFIDLNKTFPNVCSDKCKEKYPLYKANLILLDLFGTKDKDQIKNMVKERIEYDE